MVGVWVIYFMGFMLLYFLMFWIFILFVNSGYECVEGIVVLILYNLGVVVGIVLIGLIVIKIKLVKFIVIYFIGLVFFLVVVVYW